MAQVPIFRTALGINNVIEPHRLRYKDDGSCQLAEGVNVVIDDSGSVQRRLGIEKDFDGAVHSLWSKGKYCFFVSAGSLYRRIAGVNVLVTSDIGNSRMFYEVMFGKCYMSNGSVRLIVDDSSVTAWNANVPAKVQSDTRVLGIVPSFTRLCVHAGRMFVQSGNGLWPSEPGNPGCFNLGSGPMTFNGLGDFVSVGNGMYVSCEDGIYFLEGAAKEDFVLKSVYSKKAVPGTLVVLDGHDIEDSQEFFGSTAAWVSADGVCFGDARGLVKNKTSRVLEFDTATDGAAVVMPGKYFFSLEVS